MKKFLSVVLSTLMLFSLCTIGVSAEESAYKDVPSGYWATSAINKAVEQGLLNGKGNGKMDPSGLVTRGQFVTVLMRATGHDQNTRSLTGYSDVNSNTWCYKELAYANALGIIEGTSGKMNPNAPVTRQQMAAMTQRAFEIPSNGYANISKFADGAQVSTYAADAIDTFVSNGYLQGSNGKLNPNGYTTRAQLAAVMTRIASEYARTNLSGKTINGNVIISGQNAKISNCTINGNVLLSKDLQKCNLEISGCTITGGVHPGETGGALTIKGSTIEKIVVDTDSQTPAISIDSTSKVNECVIESAKTSVTMTGDIGTVTLKDADITYNINDATIKTLNIQATGAKVNLDSKSDVKSCNVDGSKVTLSAKCEIEDVYVSNLANKFTGTFSEDVNYMDVDGEDAKLSVSSGAKVTKIDCSGEDLDLSGSGTVSTVNLEKGAKGAKVSTHNTTVNNKSGGSVTVGGKTINNGSFGTTNSSGSNTSTGNSNSSSNSGTSDSSTTVTASSATFSVPGASVTEAELGVDPTVVYSSIGMSGYKVTGTFKDCRTNLAHSNNFSPTMSHYFIPLLVKVSGVRSTTTVIVENTKTNSSYTYGYSSTYKSSGSLSGNFLVWAEIDPTVVTYSDAQFKVTVDTDGVSSAYSSKVYNISYQGVTCAKDEPVDTRTETQATISIPASAQVSDVMGYIDFTDTANAESLKALDWGFSSNTLSDVTDQVYSIAASGTVYKIEGKLSANTREGDPCGSQRTANTDYVLPVVVDITNGYGDAASVTVSAKDDNGWTAPDQTYGYWNGRVYTTAGTSSLEGKYLVWLPVSNGENCVVTVKVIAGSSTSYKEKEFVIGLNSMNFKDKPESPTTVVDASDVYLRTITQKSNTSSTVNEFAQMKFEDPTKVLDYEYGRFSLARNSEESAAHGEPFNNVFDLTGQYAIEGSNPGDYTIPLTSETVGYCSPDNYSFKKVTLGDGDFTYTNGILYLNGNNTRDEQWTISIVMSDRSDSGNSDKDITIPVTYKAKAGDIVKSVGLEPVVTPVGSKNVIENGVFKLKDNTVTVQGGVPGIYVGLTIQDTRANPSDSWCPVVELFGYHEDTHSRYWEVVSTGITPEFTGTSVVNTINFGTQFTKYTKYALCISDVNKGSEGMFDAIIPVDVSAITSLRSESTGADVNSFTVNETPGIEASVYASTAAGMTTLDFSKMGSTDTKPKFDSNNLEGAGYYITTKFNKPTGDFVGVKMEYAEEDISASEYRNLTDSDLTVSYDLNAKSSCTYVLTWVGDTNKGQADVIQMFTVIPALDEILPVVTEGATSSCYAELPDAQMVWTKTSDIECVISNYIDSPDSSYSLEEQYYSNNCNFSIMKLTSATILETKVGETTGYWMPLEVHGPEDFANNYTVENAVTIGKSTDYQQDDTLLVLVNLTDAVNELQRSNGCTISLPAVRASSEGNLQSFCIKVNVSNITLKEST